MTVQPDKKQLTEVQLDPLKELTETDDLATQMQLDLLEMAPESEAVTPLSWEDISDRNLGLGKMIEEVRAAAGFDSSPTGGDVDVNQYLAKVAGEEAVGGTTPTPDQNVVEDLAASVGIKIADKATLHTSEILEQRDAHRWELEPESAEDYEERET